MKNRRNFALIPAAGMGKRMGANINKQYLLLHEKPVVAHTLQRFQNSRLIDGIILVTPLDEISFCRQEVVERYGIHKLLEIVAGGAERQHSVYNGLVALEQYAEPDDLVLIHDGARPLITDKIIEDSVRVAGNGDAALVAVPTKDTIKIVKDGYVLETPERSTLWQAQTPQTFRLGMILDAHRKAAEEQYLGTDDCSLYERYKRGVQIVTGCYRNIKITTPEDLLLAETFLAASNHGG